MTRATVADLLADLLGPAERSLPETTPAKAAKAAKNEHPCGLEPDSVVCEGLRKAANSQPEPAAPSQDSQEFAALRRVANPAQSKQPCGFSQDSQDSQGYLAANAPDRRYRLSPAEGDAAHAEAWDDAAIARFVARLGLLMRRGIDATDADDLAERLHLRDVTGDDRAICIECANLRGRTGASHCGNHHAADVGRDLPAALVTTMQRCAGFQSRG